MYKSLKKYVKKSDYFKELSNEEKESKLEVLERLLDQEEIDMSFRNKLIKNFYLSPIKNVSNLSAPISSERNVVVPDNYNLLDAVLKKERWILPPLLLMREFKECKKLKGKNFKVYLFYDENNKFSYCEPYFESKYFTLKEVAKQLM